MSSACRLNVSGKGTCKLTQLIIKQTSKLSSVICKARAHTHTHTHTSDFLWHMFYFQTFHTHTFVSVHCTFVLMILFFIHFRQYRLAAHRLTVTQLSAEGVVQRHAALDFVCYWMRAHNHGSLLVLSMCLY